MIFLDIEGTLIDDLNNRMLLQNNIIPLKKALSEWFDYHMIYGKDRYWGKKFGIFTFGWLRQDEIDYDLLYILEDNLDCVFATDNNIRPIVITKEIVMNKLKESGDFHCSDNISINEREILFNEQFTKQQAFIQYIKRTNEYNWSQLIDDQVERVNIVYPNLNKNIKLFNIKDIVANPSLLSEQQKQIKDIPLK